ncbi:N-formylglutamate amidohydrolase [Actinosynnema sp. NPDC023587]|uniref:N-formylglutamate amidohydrolase n=1 Tax=Actinosynnema sp. NPDC023587 TaxID=3154695 RepID=UPI0033D5F2B5
MSAPVLIPRGTRFSADDITFYADRERRSADEALAGADLVVGCPHAGAAIPEEVAGFLSPGLTRRLQYDFTDCTTAPVVRRWAELDPRIVYVENPHPRLVRDPNRARPADLAAGLREAFERVRAAGPGNRVDLSGCDAVRPVTFSFRPLFAGPPGMPAEALADALAEVLTAVAAVGVDVYERTRDDLVARAGPGVTYLSFHDTMNHTTRPDGAVDVPRPEADRLPPVVALSNRGDARGEPRDGHPVTMRPGSIRALADAHRVGFAADRDDVALNRPYLGSNEIVHTAARFPGVEAVQAEFRREFLLGPANAGHLMSPGTDWPDPDPARVTELALACRASWDRYRATR